MSVQIKLRNAVSEDSKLLAGLSFQTFWDAFHEHPANAPEDMAAYMAQAFSEEQIARELADQQNVFLLAEIDGNAAGYAKLIMDTIEPEITATRPIELSRLYVHQKYIGKGIGPALMDKCIETAKDLDRDVMWLGVWEFNPRAQRFYAKYGFSEVGKHIFQLGSDAQTDLLMQKYL